MQARKNVAGNVPLASLLAIEASVFLQPMLPEPLGKIVIGDHSKFLWRLRHNTALSRGINPRPRSFSIPPHFAQSISQVICPSCHLVAGALLASSGKSDALIRPSRALPRGALRGRHERWVRDAMDVWMREDDAHRCGRRSRVVLMPRRRHQVGDNACALRWRR